MTTAFFQHGWWRARRKYRFLGSRKLRYLDFELRQFRTLFYQASRRYLLALDRSAYSDVNAETLQNNKT